jgi:hypothetical protein
LQHLDRGGIGTQTVFGDPQCEVGGGLTQLDEQAFGRLARTSVVLRAILLPNGLGHQGNHCAPIGVEERRAHHLMGIGDGAMAVVLLST